MSQENLGPLAFLVGTWEGKKGEDLAPSDDRGIENNSYREMTTFDFIGEVNNHEQTLFGLRYQNMAWENGIDVPFHEEVGYWLWDPVNKQVMKCFSIPRGISLIAGGTTDELATEFTMIATLGDNCYGVSSNQFLNREFNTIKYTLTVKKIDDQTFIYNSDTELQMPNHTKIFHHTDTNVMKRIS